MGLIFFFSSQNGTASDSNSYFLINLLGKIGVNISSSMGISVANFIVRKTAHVTEYFILFMLLYFGFKRTYLKNIIIYPAIITILYSISDEFHQLFIEGRSGRIKDVFIDSIGVLIGLLIIGIKNKVKEQKTYPRA
ncbi:MAG TPA: teicoplanin resistance protein VanZ [Clostridiaceae bacterium]|jgi:VanZ family protein|nr:teicoplanin resistance protein VanZ [Clostridiaceae bacterium]HBG38801.1 teicoplanin resistance protein VanZ [Clostridiaceae bacterium]HBX48037.1 teicoplanin resistance protein VanZ [Clostridiaceae bacterium]